MWKDLTLRRGEFAAYVEGLEWEDWKPTGITLHNTAMPTLAMWAEDGPLHDNRIRNLHSFYKSKGWHAGPHLFISRNYINVFSPLTETGVHSRCYNSTHIGIEMVGDFEKEEFHSGPGAMVRDNAVYAMAQLCQKLKLNPVGLTFHRDCKLDNHACPGSKVDKSDMIGRVIKLMTGSTLPDKPLPPPVVELSVLSVQKKLADLGYYKGRLDGDRGPLTNAALQNYALAKLKE